MASHNQSNGHTVTSDVQTSGLPLEVRPARLQSCLDFVEKNVEAVAAVTRLWCGHYYGSLACQKIIIEVLKVCGNVSIRMSDNHATTPGQQRCNQKVKLTGC